MPFAKHRYAIPANKSDFKKGKKNEGKKEWEGDSVYTLVKLGYILFLNLF